MTGPAVRPILYLVLFVAVQAQAHFPRRIQRNRTIYRSAGHMNSVHRLDRPVAGLAFNSGGNVAFVREVNEIR